MHYPPIQKISQGRNMKKLGTIDRSLALAILFFAAIAAAKVICEKNAKSLLGGDVEITRVGEQAPLNVFTFLSLYSKERSLSLTRQVLVVPLEKDAVPGAKPATAVLKVVDRTYPLYGKLEFTDLKRQRPFGIYAKGTMHGASVSKSLLNEIGINPGGHFFIGKQIFVASAVIDNEPDYKRSASDLPRIMVSRNGYGALFANSYEFPDDPTYSYRVKLDKNDNVESWRNKFEEVFADQGWQVRDWRENMPLPLYGVKLPFLLVSALALTATLITRIARNK